MKKFILSLVLLLLPVQVFAITQISEPPFYATTLADLNSVVTSTFPPAGSVGYVVASDKGYVMTTGRVWREISPWPGLSPVAFTGSYNDLLDKPTTSGASPTVVSRTLNACYLVSSTRGSFVSYSVDVAATLSLLTGQFGTVIVEYSDDSGCSTNTLVVGSSANGNTGTLTIGLNLTQTSTATISGFVPANKYLKIRTVNTTGTPTFTYRAGQETLF